MLIYIFILLAPLLFGGFIVWEIVAHWRYKRGNRYLEADRTEERSTQFALEPMLLAERDRAFIKRLKVKKRFISSCGRIVRKLLNSLTLISDA